MSFLYGARQFYLRLPKGLALFFLLPILVGAFMISSNTFLGFFQSYDYIRSFPQSHPAVYRLLTDHLDLTLVGAGFIGLALIFVWAALHHEGPQTAQGTQRAAPPTSAPGSVPVTVADPEVPDDEAVPPLLDRLPGDQQSLLISLELGEKRLPLSEPGLGDLERNRLAQRLRCIRGDDYLFRLHPANSAAVRAWVAREVISHPAKAALASPSGTAQSVGHRALVAMSPESALAIFDSYCDKTLNNLEVIQQLRGLQVPCMKAARFAYEYLLVDIVLVGKNGSDEGKQIIGGLLDRYFLPQAESVNADLDKRMSAAGKTVSRHELAELTDSFHAVLGFYRHASMWIKIVGGHFFGDETLIGSEHYRTLYQRHQELLHKLHDIQHRSDIGAVAQGLRELEELLPKPPSPERP